MSPATPDRRTPGQWSLAGPSWTSTGGWSLSQRRWRNKHKIFVVVVVVVVVVVDDVVQCFKVSRFKVAFPTIQYLNRTHEFSELVLVRMALLIDSPALVGQSTGIWRVVAGKMYASALDLSI